MKKNTPLITEHGPHPLDGARRNNRTFFNESVGVGLDLICPGMGRRSKAPDGTVYERMPNGSLRKVGKEIKPKP